jgi:hypothetical protein
MVSYRIIQIILGNIPEHLKACVDSVINYSIKNNIEYRQITSTYPYFNEEPIFDCDRNKFLWRRHASDFIRTEELSVNKNTLYIDWDMFIYPDFKIENINDPCFAFDIDAMFYNGNNLDMFKNINSKLVKPNFNNNYNLAILIREYLKNNPKQQYFQGHYIHFDNCRFKMAYDLY